MSWWIALMTLLAGYFFYRKVMKSVERRRSRQLATLLTVAFLGFLAVSMFRETGQKPLVMAGLGLGTLAGVVVAIFAVRAATMEREKKRVHFEPDKRFAIGVTLLLLAWLVIRAGGLREAFAQTPFSPGEARQLVRQIAATDTWWGLIVPSFLVWYHLVLSIGVALRAERIKKQPEKKETTPPEAG